MTLTRWTNKMSFASMPPECANNKSPDRHLDVMLNVLVRRFRHLDDICWHSHVNISKFNWFGTEWNLNILSDFFGSYEIVYFSKDFIFWIWKPILDSLCSFEGYSSNMSNFLNSTPLLLQKAQQLFDRWSC